MTIQLLTDTAHSNPVRACGDEFLFSSGDNRVLSDNPGLTTIFGCPAIRVGYQKRPYNDAEIQHQHRYRDGKAPEWEHKIYAVYEVDWTKFTGKDIPGTLLKEGKAVSSGGLSDASISVFAVDTANNKVVDYIHTSYWIEDKNDIPQWRKMLLQKYGNL